MKKHTIKTALTPEQKETHSAIVKAVFGLVKMIISFFVTKKKKDKPIV